MDEKEKKGGDGLRRCDTVEMISKGLSGESDVASVHDQPKLRHLNEEKAQQFPKSIEEFEQGQKTFRPCKVSDYVDVETYPSPLVQDRIAENIFVAKSETILLDIVTHYHHVTMSREFVRGGPRKTVIHNPQKVKAVIVTCGGICPGINTVVREIYIALKELYGVEDVYGAPYGFPGFYSTGFEIKKLTDDDVFMIHHEGGSILGSSHGGGEHIGMIVDAIIDFEFNMVFVIGGDESHKKAFKIFEAMKKRKLKIGIIGIPKTIDNDIALIDKSFGFVTAVEEAQRAINSAKAEATSAFNGIGLVKLMGRETGHICMSATLASRDVDLCLIPELPFCMRGEKGVLAHIKRVLSRKGHCVIVVAEGAGQSLADGGKSWQACKESYSNGDIGLWLKTEIPLALKDEGVDTTLKYIDPTYMIRTVPPNAADNLYCAVLAQNAVHGAFAGYTGFTVGLVRTHYVYMPMEMVSKGRSLVDIRSHSWQEVMAATRQPNFSEGTQTSKVDGKDPETDIKAV
eukprot:Plantae.Rhodophyta-Purpureofilum_apyrenoidigerum.ctg10399.p1 GENE.Plantae.Rhodophyta-Purpureofilum_apyrenoidigerum.ctg10399~~Plantae.Rhodophyta-Purpureofilum_apyrenoidigerum.ctg10399.p1  ORF type:complete len:514 (-),score=87.46 Plantae.Rhodophyta-Purpureofilum_apyrenoidigerum.ctg10399:991-2532(-)